MNNRFKVFLSLACLYALLIFYLSSKSSLGDPRAILNFLDIELFRSLLHYIENSDIRFFLIPFYIFSNQPDKLAHILLYAGFGFLLYLALKNSPNNIVRNHAFIVAVIIGTMYGVSDEFHQSFVPGRIASIWDLLADSIGLAMAQAVVFIKDKLSALSKKNSVPTLDLKIAIILIILSIIFILISPFNQTFLRIILALPLLLFLPGYLFIAAMFPKRGELSPIERFTLSIGLSIAITVFDGFALNYTPWGFRPNSIVISLSLIMGILIIAGYLQRWRLGENAYEFSAKDIISFYRTLRSKETETGPDYDPALEKMLIKTMIIAIFLVTAMLVYAKVTTEPEKFTAFYILGSNGKAEDYPGEIYINKPTQLLAGIENYEYQPVNYTLRVQLDDRILKEQPVYLTHESKWLENVTFTPRITSSIALSKSDNRYKLEFILLKNNARYRSVHLWVKPIFDISEFTPAIILKSSDMEQIAGWEFMGSSENITGDYTNGTWISPSHSYLINFNASDPGEYGEISQNVSIDKESIATLSFYVKDSYSNTTANISKQVLLDRNIVWEGGVGNKSWEKISVPVFFSKDARIAFRVYNKIPVNNSFQVWLDDIKIEPYNKPGKDTMAKTTPVPALLNNYPQLEFKIRGMPVAMNGNAVIDGSNFPGFYYDIDENKSYEKLDLFFSENSTIEAGNATYISTLHGNEISILGSGYKIINRNDIGLLSKVLLKDGSKTLNFSDKWDLDNGYSLSLKLISSKGDTAMLELWKGSSLLDSRLLGTGATFEYRANVAKNTAIIFKTKIDSISSDSVKVKETELYSDNPVTLSTGNSVGDFEVTNISSEEIIMKNSYPIKVNDGALILGGNIKLRVNDGMMFPYSLSGEIRGMPQSTRPGSLMMINGSNYPGFYYDFDNSNSPEELSMYFAYNSTVEIGNAVYKTRNIGKDLYFLGNSYWLPNPQKINFLSGFSTITRTIPRNGSLSLENGYSLSLKEKPDDSVEIFVKKDITKSEMERINNTNISGLFKDFYYEMFTTTFKNGRLKSNVLFDAGDEFEYWIEYGEDRKYMFISGEIKTMDHNNVSLEIRKYQIPRELVPGMTFGEFEIESIADDTIVLKNIKPLKFEPGKETPVLGGDVRIRTSAREPIAYSII